MKNLVNFGNPLYNILSLTLSLYGLTCLTACQPANNATNQANNHAKTHTASQPTNHQHPMVVYAATNVWGSVAKAVGADNIEVIAAVNDPSQDPHAYQASAQDKLNVSKAKLVLVNGGGYDDWATSLAQSVATKPVIINAVEISGLRPASTGQQIAQSSSTPGFNEHVFFSLDTAKKVAQAVQTQLSASDPSHQAQYDQNTQQFMQQIDGLKTKAHTIGAGKRLTALATEPVTGYLLADMGIKDITPQGYTEQAETEAGVSVKLLNDSHTLLRNKQAQLLIVNAQTEDATAKTLIATANQAGVPVVQVNETFPTGITSYVDFIEKTLTNFANAVK